MAAAQPKGGHKTQCPTSCPSLPPRCPMPACKPACPMFPGHQQIEKRPPDRIVASLVPGSGSASFQFLIHVSHSSPTFSDLLCVCSQLLSPLIIQLCLHWRRLVITPVVMVKKIVKLKLNLDYKTVE